MSKSWCRDNVKYPEDSFRSWRLRFNIDCRTGEVIKKCFHLHLSPNRSGAYPRSRQRCARSRLRTVILRETPREDSRHQKTNSTVKRLIRHQLTMIDRAEAKVAILISDLVLSRWDERHYTPTFAVLKGNERQEQLATGKSDRLVGLELEASGLGSDALRLQQQLVALLPPKRWPQLIPEP